MGDMKGVAHNDEPSEKYHSTCFFFFFFWPLQAHCFAFTVRSGQSVLIKATSSSSRQLFSAKTSSDKPIPAYLTSQSKQQADETDNWLEEKHNT